MDYTEYRILNYRCVQTRRRFFVVFGRYSASHRFQVVKVVDEKDYVPDESLPGGNTAKLQNSTGRTLDVSPPKASSLSDQLKGIITALLPSSSALVRMGERLLSGQIPSPQAKGDTNAQGNSSARTDSFKSDEFDLTGWYCPCCGHAKQITGQTTLFVRCNKCKETVCGARVHYVGDKRLFACHDGCGNTGKIGEKSVTSYSGAKIDLRQQPMLPGERKQLPPTSGKSTPNRSLPPPKDRR